MSLWTFIRPKPLAWAVALLAICGSATVQAQTNRTWTGASSGAWGTSGNWASTPAAGNRLIFNNNAQLISTNNLGFNINGIVFTNGASSNRTIVGNVALTDWSGVAAKIEVSSSSAQTATFTGNIGLNGGSSQPYEINPVGGSIIIGGAITNLGSGKTNIFWGNNAENDLVRSVIVSNGIQGGGGKIILRQYANVILMGNSTYTGNTEIDVGTLKLGSGTMDGTLSDSSNIYVGSGVTAGNAKLTLGKTDGGQVLGGTGGLQINSGSGLRTIQSDNTSGTNTIARMITNNAQLFITNAAGGTLRFEGSFANSANSLVIRGAATNAIVDFAAANSFSNIFVDHGHATFSANNSWGLGAIAIGVTTASANAAAVSFTTNFTVGAGIDVRTNAADKTILYTAGGGVLTLNGAITNNATGTTRGLGLDVASGGAMLINGQIGGAGNVTTVNGGTVVLNNAANSFGALQISNGTVVASNSFTATGLSGAGNLDIAGGTATVNNSADYVFDGGITGAGSFAKTGSGQLTLASDNSGFTGNMAISGGQLLVGHGNAMGSGGNVSIGSGGALLLSNNISIARPITSLGGNTGLAFGALQSASGTNEWTGTITLGADAGVSAAAGATLVLNSIAAGDNALWVAGDGDTMLNGTITSDRGEGTTSFVKTNTGTVYVMGSNSLGGSRFIREGTVVLGNDNAFGSTGATILGGLNSASSTNAAVLALGQGVTHSGEIRIQPTTTNNALRVLAYNAGTGTGTLSGSIVLSNNVTFDVSGGGTLHSSGTLSGPGVPQIVKTGAGTFIASGTAGDNKIKLADGTIVIGANNALSTGVSTAARAIDMGMDGANAVTTNNVALYASNGVTVSNSIYVAANAGGATRTLGAADSSATVTFNNEIYLDGSVRLEAASGSEAIFSGNLINTGGIEKTGAGTVTLTGANTYSGGTLVSGGTLRVGNGGTTGRFGSGNITNNAAVIVNRADSYTIANDISGTGTLTQNGAGTLVLSGNNSYSGLTTINAGTLGLGGTGTTIAGNILISGGTLNYSTTANEQISSSSTVTMSSGLFALGARTQTIASLGMSGGETTIGGGALTLTGNSSITGGSVNVTGAGGNFRFGTATTLGNTTLTYSNASTQTGAFVLNGDLNVNPGTTATLSNGLAGVGRINLTNGIRTIDVGNAGHLDIGWTIFSTTPSAGGIIKNGAGTLTLRQSSSFTGGFTLNSGTVLAGNDAALGGASGLATLNGGTIASIDSTTRTFANALAIGGNVTFGQTSGGTGALNFTNTSGINLGNAARTLTVEAVTTIAGALTNGSIVKEGGATLNLSNTANNIANLSIGAGTVAFHTSATVGGLSGSTGTALNIDAGTLTVNASTNSTFAQTISGAGALAKTGSGTLTLNGTNTYSGSTTVSGGTLAIGGVNTNSAILVTNTGTLAGTGTVGNVVVAAGGTISPGNSPGNITVGDFEMGAGGSYLWEIGSVTGTPGSQWDLITITGTTTISAFAGPGNTFTINITGSSVTGWDQDATHSWEIMDWSSGTGPVSFDPSAFTLVTSAFTDPISGTFSLSTNSTSLLLTYTGGGGTPTYSTNSGTWSTNFTPAIANGNNAIFDGPGGAATNDISSATLDTIGSILFATNAGAYVLTADSGSAGFNAATPLIVGGNIVNDSANAQVVDLAVSIGGTMTVDAASNNIAMGNTITGSGGITKTGAHTLTLSGSNNFTGPLRIEGGMVDLNRGGDAIAQTIGSSTVIALDGGTLRLTASSNPNASMTYGGLEVFDGGGTLEISRTATATGITATNAANLIFREAGTLTVQAAPGGTQTSTTVLFTGTNTLEADAAISVGAATELRLNNAVTGDHSLTKAGVGTLTLVGNNTYSGGTLISGGTLQIGNNTGSGNLTGNVTNNGTLAFNRTGAATYAGDISGTGNFVKQGAGTLTLSGNSSYSGGSTLAAGGLQLNTTTAAGTGTIVQTGGASTLRLNATGTFANNMSLYNVAFLTNGTILSGTITNNNTTYDVASGTTNTLSGFLTGDGGVTLIGGGVLQITGATNNYGGATTLSNGTLRVTTLADAGAASSIGTNATINLAGATPANAIFDYTGGSVAMDRNFVLSNGGGTFRTADGNAVVTATGSASGTGTFVVDGPGTLVLSNSSTANSFAPDAIQINGGATLALGSDNQIGNSTGLILNGGTFLLGGDDYRYSEQLGTLTLTASSTIDFGSWSGGTNTLQFADSSAITWTGTLTIANWQGVAQTTTEVTQLLFGVGGLNSTQLGQIYFSNQNIPGGELIGGELVPVPEPQVYAAVLALLAFIGWRERRRLLGLIRRH